MIIGKSLMFYVEYIKISSLKLIMLQKYTNNVDYYYTFFLHIL